jgi:hypothetical protein
MSLNSASFSSGNFGTSGKQLYEDLLMLKDYLIKNEDADTLINHEGY